MYRIGLVENDPEDRKRIHAMLETFFAAQPYDCAEFSLSEAFLSSARQNSFDVVIFDVELGGLNGIEAAKQLRQHDCRVIILFATSHPESVFSSFAAEPLNYLLKPISKAAFFDCMKKAIEKLEMSARDAFRFSFGGAVYSVPVPDIRYFESDKRLIVLHAVKQTYKFYGKLSELETQPQLAGFLRCHHSLFVNPMYVLRVNAAEITLRGGDVLPVSKSRTRDVQRRYMDYIAGTL